MDWSDVWSWRADLLYVFRAALVREFFGLAARYRTHAFAMYNDHTKPRLAPSLADIAPGEP